KIASKSPTAVQIGKSSFYEIADLEYAKALDFVSQHFASLCATEEAKIGYNAFKEKKTITW
ncbi:MAG: enoyl-CoA hydratase/isomerase family protein, partial [Eubacteriales bacterium]|nr:enoyl-CoA hydratase/isomerase family protein [Eubacteriales bacterium]